MVKTAYTIKLLSYPILQLVSLLLSFYMLDRNMLLAMVFLFLAIVFMNFSLHISYHFHVHHKSKNKFLNRLKDFYATIHLGMPFHLYQMQHLNHHLYNNEIGDFTSTYMQIGDAVQAKPLWRYVLLFWVSDGRKNQFKIAKNQGYLSQPDRLKIRWEGIFNLIILGLICYWDWHYTIVFGIMIYFGWSLIALHNYGQHLPVEKQGILGFSYYGKIYNWLFLNNGLHYEHHRQPATHYWDLKNIKNKAGHNDHIHLIDPFFLQTIK